MFSTRVKYRFAVVLVYLALPYTLVKQRLFFRWRKAPDGLPGFLCIGAQKSGTTWLNNQLRSHPALCMPFTRKEGRYFDLYFYRSFRWYLSNFNCQPGKLKGDVTPGYSIIEKGRVRFIRRTMPQVKIIFLLRDPRERAWSSARYHLGTQLGRNLQDVTPQEFIAHCNTKWVKRMGDYPAVWKKWTSLFPREQFLVIFTEEIERQPEEVMKKICSFLDVEMSTDREQLFSHPNKSGEMEIPGELKLFLDRMYVPVITSMPEWLGMENKYWKV